MKRYVYVMKSDAGLVKIGVSINPDERRAAVETGSGFRVQLVELFGPFNAATAVESAAHALLKDVRRRGEWFDCSAADAAAAVRRAIESHDDPADPTAEEERHRKEMASELARWMASKLADRSAAAAAVAEGLIERYGELVREMELLTDKYLDAVSVADSYADIAKSLIRQNKVLVARLNAQSRADPESRPH